MSTRRRAVVRLVVAAVVLVAIAAAARLLAGDALADPAALVTRLRGTPAIIPLFVIAYALAAAFALPATPFTLVGGALFGVGLGSLLNWLGATLGATGSFLIARGLAGDAVRGALGERAQVLDALRGRGGTAAIARLRLVPVVPFNGLTLAAAAAGVSLRAFVVGTGLGIIPGTVIYTWFAERLLAGATDASRTAFLQLALAAGALVALSFVPALVRRVSRDGDAPTPPAAPR